MTRKLYWENPYLHEAESEIVKREKKDGKIYLTLNRTIFYPDMSGGQPGDIGSINGEPVLQTMERNGDLVHVLAKDISGKSARMEIDPSHRQDLMQQHTGQHLLSGVLYNLMAAETISFHLGDDYSTIDVTADDLSQEDEERAELLCNKIIQSNFHVKSYFVDNEKIKQIPVRKAPSVNEDIRVVEIDGFDYSPCGGTHVSQTGELGILKIMKWERYKGNIRIQFLVGGRAFKDYATRFNSIKAISSLLSAGHVDIESKVSKIYEDRASLEKQNRELKKELLEIKSSSIVENASEVQGVRIAGEIFDHYDFKELSNLSSHISSSYENTVQIYGISNDGLGQFIISKTKDVNVDLQKIYSSLSSRFKVKGGGNSNTVQGSVSTDALDRLLNDCYESIKAELEEVN